MVQLADVVVRINQMVCLMTGIVRAPLRNKAASRLTLLISHKLKRIHARRRTKMATRILPLELIDKAIGSQIWILLRGTKEVVGTLRGFDDYVSFLLRVFGGNCFEDGLLLYIKAGIH